MNFFRVVAWKVVTIYLLYRFSLPLSLFYSIVRKTASFERTILITGGVVSSWPGTSRTGFAGLTSPVKLVISKLAEPAQPVLKVASVNEAQKCKLTTKKTQN